MLRQDKTFEYKWMEASFKLGFHPFFHISAPFIKKVKT